MIDELDVQARRAASAARDSVAGPASHAVQGDPPSGRSTAVLRTAFLAMAVVAAGLLAAAVSRSGDTTQVAAGSARTTVTTRPPPPPPGLLPPRPANEPALGSGTASDGRPWTLSIGGPSDDLCFSMTIDEVIGSSVCAGQPPGRPVPANDRYQPLLYNDSRARPFVAGRVPSGVVEVEAELASGNTTARRPVLPAPGDAVYAIELEGRTPPQAVIGIRADGTTTRHPLP